MSSISDPKNAIQQIAFRLKDSKDPDDPGVLAEFGDELLAAAATMARKVRQTNKACTGEVTLTFKLKAYRTPNREVAIELHDAIKSKKPTLTRERSVQLYAGHDGELETQPVQEEMPLFDKESATVIDGGKVEGDKGQKPKKGSRAI
jgi:hypothetical protein